jgi:hypothetical protein
MNTTTTTRRVAAQLRAIADVLDHAGELPVTDVRVSIAPSLFKAVDAVDALAARFGLTAETATSSGSTWYHEARDDRDGVHLRLYTIVDAPAKRCACGAACTHTDGAR